MIIHISGCAGSATHKVVTANQAGDTSLACEEIESELIKAQAIIDEVNRDKEDMTGADVVDGILWFPFNLIAKSENYKNALEAADRRILRLNQLKAQKKCSDIRSDETTISIQYLSEKLRELSRLHKEGILTDQEYMDAKKKVLDKDLSTVNKPNYYVKEEPTVKVISSKYVTKESISESSLIGATIKGVHRFQGGKNPVEITINLHNGEQATMKLNYHNVMWGGPRELTGRWWITQMGNICLNIGKLDECRAIVQNNGSLILVSEMPSEPKWKLEM